MSISVSISILLAATLCSISTATSSTFHYNMSPSLVPGFSSCRFQDVVYDINATFHPTVRFEGLVEKIANTCAICTCKPTTLVQCEPSGCPNLTNCSNSATIKGECCERCFDSEIELFKEKSKMLSCVSHGVVYDHNEVFHPLLESDANPFCTSCKCDNGTVNCQDISSYCPKVLGCAEKDQYVPAGHCCKTCPIPETNNGECLDERNRVRKHGESWPPVYNGVVVTCWNCTCKNGNVSCKKNCPPVSTLPLCKNGEPEYSASDLFCCPKCTKTKIVTPPPSTNGTTSTTTSTSTPSGTTIPSPTLLPYTCNRAKYTHKVYLCHDELGMALEDTRNNTIQLYNWLPGNVKNIQYMTSKEFYLSECALKFQGFALLRRVNGLRNRSSKAEKIDNCTKKCAKLVVSMLRPIQCT